MSATFAQTADLRARVAPGGGSRFGPRLLLLDEGFMSGTHTAVGLRGAGCVVEVLAATGGRGACARSDLRWRLAPPVASDAFIEMVDVHVRSGSFDLVLPLTEPIQQRVWSVAPPWRDRIFPRLDHDQRVLIGDKRLVSARAATIGLRVPREVALGGAGVAEGIRGGVRLLGLPLVVKGTRGRGGSATRIAESEEGAIAAARELRARGGECFLQRHVRGATYIVGGLFHEGRPIRLYVAEKLELYPARTGPSIVLRTVREPRLVSAALSLFAALRLDALASMDFVREGAGEFHFIELNPRPWGSIASAAAAGVDLFTPFAALLRGERPAADLSYRVGVESRVFPLYLLASAHWRGLRALREAAQDLRGSQGAPWREPAQALHMLHRLTRVAVNWRSH